jgi:hypothetical protein
LLTDSQHRHVAVLVGRIDIALQEQPVAAHSQALEASDPTIGSITMCDGRVFRGQAVECHLVAQRCMSGAVRDKAKRRRLYLQARLLPQCLEPLFDSEYQPPSIAAILRAATSIVL